MAYNGTSGIPVSGSFRLRVSEPVDSRYVINNELELELLIADNAFYPGLEFTLLQNAGSYSAGKYFVKADGTFKKIYNLDGTSPDYLISSDLSGYASEEYVREQINNAQIDPGQVDLSDYYKKSETYKKSEVDTKVTEVEAKIPSMPTIPDKLSDFNNDVGFITGIEIDSALSETSENPVQNKVIYGAFADKAAKDHTHDNRYSLKDHKHTLNDITDYVEPEIPKKLSDLTNDTGYISSSVADSTYVKKDELVWHEF